MTPRPDENVVLNPVHMEEGDRDEQHWQEKAQALMEEARACKAFFIVLILHLGRSDDPRVQMVAAELSVDRDWQAFIFWCDQRRLFACLKAIGSQADE